MAEPDAPAVRRLLSSAFLPPLLLWALFCAALGGGVALHLHHASGAATEGIYERAEAAEVNHDPLETAPDLERAWRAYARRPSAGATKDGRLTTDSTTGMITKAVNLRTMRAHEPAVRIVDTFNAEVNTHMIAINEAMGFRAVDRWANWQVSVA